MLKSSRKRKTFVYNSRKITTLQAKKFLSAIPDALWSRLFQVLRGNFFKTGMQYQLNYKLRIRTKGRYFHTIIDETRYGSISVLFIFMYVIIRKMKNINSWKCIILRSEYGDEKIWVRTLLILLHAIWYSDFFFTI